MTDLTINEAHTYLRDGRHTVSSAIAQLTLVTDESEYTLRANGNGLTISAESRP